MARLIKKEKGNYTNISNIILRDDRLHWNARGLFGNLWSQSNEWKFFVKEIVKHSPGGETELRNAMAELKKYGYLKIVPRRKKDGSFEGNDWILSDTGDVNEVYRDSDNTTSGKNKVKDTKKKDKPVSGKTKQKKLKKIEKRNFGKSETRSTGTLVNRRLRNNNIKNYQIQELTNTRSSSSSKEKIKDPFEVNAGSKEEEDKTINNLIDSFVKETGSHVSSGQRNQINGYLHQMSLTSATECVYRVIGALSNGNQVLDGTAYLIRSLMNQLMDVS